MSPIKSLGFDEANPPRGVPSSFLIMYLTTASVTYCCFFIEFNILLYPILCHTYKSGALKLLTCCINKYSLITSVVCLWVRSSFGKGEVKSSNLFGSTKQFGFVPLFFLRPLEHTSKCLVTVMCLSQRHNCITMVR